MTKWLAKRRRADAASVPEVLDSSAILALLRNEPGGEAAASLLPECVVSAVNEAEVLRVLARAGAPVREAERILSRLLPNVVPFDSRHAVEVAAVSQLAPALSLGDCACLALARLQPERRVYTTDRVWAKVQVGVDVRLLR